MLKALANSIEFHLDAILFAACTIFFMWGVGYLITKDMANEERAYNTCIEAGKQFIEGNCVN